MMDTFLDSGIPIDMAYIGIGFAVLLMGAIAAGVAGVILDYFLPSLTSPSSESMHPVLSISYVLAMGTSVIGVTWAIGWALMNL